jgi:hypothetical protein
MRRTLVAFAVAALCVLGADATTAATHALPRSGAPAVTEATAVVRVAAVAVPVPQPELPSLGAFLVVAATASAAATALRYLARQRRRAVLVPVFASSVRRRGPPTRRAHR